LATASLAEAPPRPAASLSRRILLFSLAWIVALLSVGGIALDRVVTQTLTATADAALADNIPAMIAAAEVDPFGDIRFNRDPFEPRYSEPYSGRYWQVSTRGRPDFRSRSLWDRTILLDLDRPCPETCIERFEGFEGEPLRIAMRDAILPGSPEVHRFAVGESAALLDRQVARIRRTLWIALGALAAGLFALAWLQTAVGLLPLKRLSNAIAGIRSGRFARVPLQEVPPEVGPLVGELNALLDHNANATEAARRHAGNLAHALKTPLSVLLNAAEEGAPDLAPTVKREVQAMRRHVDHHLARARAAARRSDAAARAAVWPALEAIASALTRIYADRGVVIDIDGDRSIQFRGEGQDLDDMLGNILDNAAKYGGGRVFVTVSGDASVADILVEDDGPGIPESARGRLFERGARLDLEKPGTGLGLSIARELAEIYGGTVTLGESEDLGGLAVRLALPRALP
jgi:signal transduction histidine kinase